jgi:mannose-6-phosphate isomerase-like protein (cupin superfamily)
VVHAIALRLLMLLLVAAIATGCGAPTPRTETSTSGGEATRDEESDGAATRAATSDAGGTGAAMAEPVAPAAAVASEAVTRGARDRLSALPTPEPMPFDAHEWTLAPAQPPRVMLGSLELPPGESFRPPTSRCQDVILFVREGQLEAIGTGIASPETPATLYAGDAVRFGPEGDGIAVNVGATRARTVVAVARPAGTGAPRASVEGDDRCAVADASRDPLRRTIRIASIATTPPLTALGGGLEIRILLDADGSGAEHAAVSWLEGAPDLAVPEHRHPGSAEILLIEEGEGTMRIGDREIAVRPGAAIYVPEGALHSLRSAGTRPLRALQVYAPGGPEQRFRGAGR